MAYRYSHKDQQNLGWFARDNSRASLVSLELGRGEMRGLKPFNLDITYPITAIAGANGSGKSTLLALAACAFHNGPAGYKPPMRKNAYYTFSDFFIQSSQEVPPDGVIIRYGIRNDNWRRSAPAGIGHQSRIKRSGGRWNDYHTRVKRNVVYFGVQRVVPHFERSTHKSYRSRFRPGNLPDDVKVNIAAIAGRILGKDYTSFDNHEHSKYSLPFVTVHGVEYSGFNMGAGESAVFEILTALFLSGEGTLLVIDEIELGLHEKAQCRLIDELKQLCYELKCQVICSTHSHTILRSLPPEGRFFIENGGTKTVITPGVSADFACGKMGRQDAQEVDIFVEDDVAKAFISQWLPMVTRKRVRIIPIGSHDAVLRQLTSRYLENNPDCLCVLDGDQRRLIEGAKSKVAKYAEASTPEEIGAAKGWAEERIFHLPGNEWPEKWLLENARDYGDLGVLSEADRLVDDWGLTDQDELLGHLCEALQAGKHNEFFTLGELVDLEMSKVRSDIVTAIKKTLPDSLDVFVQGLAHRLDG